MKLGSHMYKRYLSSRTIIWKCTSQFCPCMYIICQKTTSLVIPTVSGKQLHFMHGASQWPHYNESLWISLLVCILYISILHSNRDAWCLTLYTICSCHHFSCKGKRGDKCKATSFFLGSVHQSPLLPWKTSSIGPNLSCPHMLPTCSCQGCHQKRNQGGRVYSYIHVQKSAKTITIKRNQLGIRWVKWIYPPPN